jgi:hypothetical protein
VAPSHQLELEGSIKKARVMSILSAILYFLTQNPFKGILTFVLVGAILGAVMAIWRGRKTWYLLIVVFYVLGSINVFATHFLNSLFLNAFGTEGSAVIVHSEETDTQLNDKYVWSYDVLLKTADGRDVMTSFYTDSASIYPIRNAILIPPEGERFVAKYIPGFERNIVIMSDLSGYGTRRLINEDRQPVLRAAALYAASPNNPTFIDEYRVALRSFIAAHREDDDSSVISAYRKKLAELDKIRESQGNSD